MATAESIDEYLATVPEPKRATLEAVRASIRRAAPDAEECISYGMPAYRLPGKGRARGKVVAGFAAFAKHLAYLPHSGRTFEAMADELDGYTYTDGSLHFAIDQPLPDELVERLVEVRRAELDA